MGAIQGAVNSMLGTAAASAAIGKKVKADIKKANAEAEQAAVAKVAEAENLQDEYIRNQTAIQDNKDVMKGLKKDEIKAKLTGDMDELKAARKSLSQMRVKQKALNDWNTRRAEQYKALTGQNIIGGKKDGKK